MSKITGVVTDIKGFAAGNNTMYSIFVDGARYGTGPVKPSCNVGDTISFDVIQKGQYLNVVPRSITVVSAASPSEQARATTAAARGGGGGYNDPARQDTISKQAAINSAIAFMNVAQAAGAIPGVTAKTSAEQKFELLEQLTMRKVSDFYSFSTGNDRLDGLDGSAKNEAPAPEWPE